MSPRSAANMLLIVASRVARPSGGNSIKAFISCAFWRAASRLLVQHCRVFLFQRAPVRTRFGVVFDIFRERRAVVAGRLLESFEGDLAALEREDVVEPLCGLAHGHVAVLRAESRSSLRLIWREIRRFECLKVCHVSPFE